MLKYNYIMTNTDKVLVQAVQRMTQIEEIEEADFITISKSWSSLEASNQINAMQKYFDDHWNHNDAVRLEDVSQNPEFKQVLEKLANKESKHLETISQMDKKGWAYWYGN